MLTLCGDTFYEVATEVKEVVGSDMCPWPFGLGLNAVMVERHHRLSIRFVKETKQSPVTRYRQYKKSSYCGATQH